MATLPQRHIGTQRLGPSDFLMAAFRACPRDPTEEIKSRLSHMLREFMQHCQTKDENEMKKESVERCCLEAEIRYFKMLENIVKEPRQHADISTILCHESVQGCLVACCLDITITLNQLPCDFTVLLHIFKLAAHHFPLVIEVVWGSRMNCISDKEAKHLRRVEIKILERLAWTSDSPLWKEVRANDHRFPACYQVISPAQLEELKKADLPPEPDQPQAPASLEIPTNVDQPCSTPAITRSQKIFLDVFTCKVYKLMACRLSEMCSELRISDELRGNIWTCFERSLVCSSKLMVDSHLDQLLLYTIFNITKITNSNLTLNDIVKCYKSQQYASQTVGEDMVMLGTMENLPTEMNDDGDHTGIMLTPITPSGPEMKERLIHFHQNYRQKMQHYVQQYAPTFGGDTPQSPYPLLRKKSAAPHRLHNNCNIFISLLKENSYTGTPGYCYYFGSSSSQSLRELSSKIKASSSSEGVCRAVSFEDVDGEEDGPPSKRLRLDRQSALERRLERVVSDRAKVGNQDQV